MKTNKQKINTNSMPPNPQWVSTLARKYAGCFPKTPAWRTIGREAEFPVVRSDNGEWADVHWLLHTILEHGGDSMEAGTREVGPKRRSMAKDRIVKVDCKKTGTTWTAEVGGGTVEVINGPCQDLHELKEKHEVGVAV